MDTKRTVWFLVGLLALLLLGWAGVQEAAAAPDAPAANKTITTITEDNPDPSVYGQGYYVRFSLDTDPYNGITPYGTVTVDDGESHTCSRHCWSTDSYCPDDWYIWWWGCTLTGSTPGVKTITATFVPSDTTKYKGSTTTTTHVVNKGDSKTTLASSPNPSAEGQSVTFTATVVAVAPGSGTPTGSVEFYADGVLLGTGTLNSSGVATLSTTTLTAGVHWITAVYLGDANFRGSESAALAQRVADADLRIIKLVKPDGEIQAGGTVVYTVLVDNLGPGTASNLVLSDTMTASGDYSVLSVAPNHSGTCSPTAADSSGTNNAVTIRCTLASLPAHQRWTIIVTAVADETIDINNVAGVYATSPSDPNLDNNYASGAIAVTETDTADLAVAKTAVAPTTVDAGEGACWEVTVTNNGPSAAENVVLVDLLPLGLVDGSITTGSAPGCSYGTPGDPADPFVCNVGTLADGGSWSVTVCGNVDPAFVLNQPDTSQANYLDNDAWAYADTFDPDNSDNRDTAYVEVTESADLSLAKDAFGTPVAGTEIHYKYQIANAGPSWSEDVTLRDSLPDEVEFLGALVDFENGTGGVPLACDVTAGSNVLFCPLGDIPPTGSHPIVVFVNVRIKPDATGSLINTADVNLHDTPDPNTANNSATKTVTVQNGASLSIVKTAADPSPVAGGEQIYTILVTNDGPSTAPEVEIVDLLPPPSQVTPLYASDSACTFSVDPTVVSMNCPVGDLGPGETYQVDLHVRLAADLECGSAFVNRARASWYWDGTGVSTEVTTPIDCEADLAIRKFGKPDGEVRAGEELIYRLVVDNLGPSAAPNVVVTDTIISSGEFTVGSWTSIWHFGGGSGGSCDELLTVVLNGQQTTVVACTLEKMPPSARTIIEFGVTADETQDINDLATVKSDAFDPDGSNNQAIIQHEITDVADLSVSKEAVGEVQVWAQHGLTFDSAVPGQAFPTAPNYTASPTEVTAGRRISYTLTVANAGPSTAENVFLNDRLPAGVQIYPGSLVAPAGAGCATGTPGEPLDRLTCGLGTIPAGESKQVTFQVIVDPALPEGTALENDAFAGSDLYDPNNGDNAAHSQTVVNSFADRWLVHYGTGSATAGMPHTFFLRAGNLGPSLAEDMVLWYQLPAEVEFLDAFLGRGATGIPLSCGVEAKYNIVGCALGDVPPSALDYLDIVINVRVKPDAAGTLHSNAWVDGATNDPYMDNNGRDYAFLVEQEANLAIAKTSEPMKVFAGEQKKYTLTVINHGPSDAQEVVVVDTLPAELAYEIDNALCDVSGQVVSCALGTLPAGASRSFDIWALVDPAALPGTILLNEAEVASATADPVPANNLARSENLVLGKADLRVVKFGKPDGEVRAGENLTYTVIVDNLGPGYAHGIVLADLLQSSGTFELVSVESYPPAKCTPASGTFSERLELTCDLEDPLEVQGRWLLTVIVTAAETQDINNQATVWTADLDPDPGNNHAEVMHEISDVADLAVEKRGPETVTAGGDSRYSITVTNNGPSTAENVVVIDRLPAGIAITGIDYDGFDGQCATGTPGSAADRLTCALGSLPAGGTATIGLDFEVAPDLPAGMMLENDVLVASDIYDPDNSNNLDYVLTRVATEADLGFVKFDTPDPVIAGRLLTFPILIINHGPSVARDVRLYDRLPPGTRYHSDTLPGAQGCEITPLEWTPYGLPLIPAGAVRCDLGDLQPGQFQQFSLALEVDPSVPEGSVLENLAILLSLGTDDPFLENNVSTTDTTVVAEADLQIAKAGMPTKVYAGEQVRYTVTVANLGPSDAQQVVVVDTLPAELAYEIDTALCDVAGQVVTCALGTLPAGAARSLEIWALVDPATLPGTFLLNEAAVASATADPVQENNAVQAENLVLGKADLKVVKFGKMDGEVLAGDMLTYTVVVDNLGPGYAHDVELVDLLQSSGTFELVSVTSDRPALCVPESGTFTERLQLSCTLTDPLEVQGRWLLTVIVTADETQDLNNLAVVYTSDLDPESGNNQAYVEHAITDVSDLNVSKCAWWEAKNKWECGDDAVPVVAGETARYRLYLTNNGPSTAQNPVIVDTLPLGTSLVSLDDPGWDCSITQPGVGQTAFTCGYPNLASGEMVYMTYTVLVDPSVPEGAILVNGASGTSDLFDPNAQNNYDEMLLKVGVKNELWIEKTDEPDPVIAGNTLLYYVEAGNNGPSTAWDVRLWDGLPAQVVFQSATVVNRGDTICSYAAVAHEINCATPALKPGETVWLKVEVRVKGGTAGNSLIHNEAEVWSTADQAATAETTKVLTRADLSLEKVGEPAKVTADGQVKYTLTVKNNGPSAAQDVVVGDDLPEAVQAELLPSECLEVTAGRVECELGSMAAGEVRAIELWVRVKAGARDGTQLYNEACVSGSTTQGDPDAANDCDDATGLVLGLADLKVAKYGPAGAVTAGEDLTYLIIVDNLGPGYAHRVAVEDVLQSTGRFELVSVTSDRPAGCSPASGAFDRLLEMRCELDGALEVRTGGASGRWILTAVLRAVESQSINNIAGVTGADPDPNLANNEAVVQSGVSAVADLAIEKLASGQMVIDGCGLTTAIDHVTAGLELTYLLTVSNNGPSDAAEVTLEDRLPAGIVVTGVSASQGSCQTGTPGASGDKLTCGLGALAAGEEAEVTIVALVPADTPAGTILENDAAVSSAALDTNNANDAAVNLMTVTAAANLALDKQQSPAFVMPGDEVTYRLTVENWGPSDAVGAVVSDTMPAALVDVSWECIAYEGASCPASGTGDLAHPVDLPAGGRLVFTIRGIRDRFGTGPTLTNSAELLSPAGVLDCNPADNADTVVNRLHKVYLPLVPKGRDLPPAPDLVVREILFTANGAEVVIANRGTRSVENPFWVDLYLDPNPAPAAVNETWPAVALQGMAWGVSDDALPLEPGETLTLRYGDPFYAAAVSYVEWPIEAGTAVYVQVDSSGDPAYGGVLENHEMVGWRYNNISGPVEVVTAVGEPPAPLTPLPEGRGMEGLPPR